MYIRDLQPAAIIFTPQNIATFSASLTGAGLGKSHLAPFSRAVVWQVSGCPE